MLVGVRIVQVTPGAGAMYCGNCLRDNALVRSLRQKGHDVLMVPVYLPLRLDEADESASIPVFFSGINVFLDQEWTAFSRAPSFLRRLLSSRPLLQLAAGRAAKTRPEEVGALTLSMLQGEGGRQERDLEELTVWLETQPRPHAVILSNALLIGMARRLKQRLGCKIICHLGGEDSFLNALPESHRELCWAEVAERARELDLLLSPTRYFANVMGSKLSLQPGRIAIVPNGISMEGYSEAAPTNTSPVLGFFTRMSREKGLDTLVRAFIQVRKRGRASDLKLKVGGSCGPADMPLVHQLTKELAAAGLGSEATWHPNVDRPSKIAFLRSLSIFSAPAMYGEAFGLYVIEAMAAGVPVVQPNTASFPELIEATGGGRLFEPDQTDSLADAIEHLALNPAEAAQLGAAGRRAVCEQFTADRMADSVLGALSALPAR